MKSNIKKILKTAIYSILGIGIVSATIASSVINSRSNTTNLFAEIIVSDNTSILSDKSFSESAFDGYKNFLNSKGITALDQDPSNYREGFGLWRRPGSTVLDREITFKGVFANGKDLIIAPGFNHADSINNVLKDSRYNEKGFLLLDSNIDPKLQPRNAVTATFRMEQAGFQVGVAASEFLFVNRAIFGPNQPDSSLDELKIGAFVGLAFPSTMDFLIGFQKGMVAWNEANESSRPGYKRVEWVPLGLQPNNYASGSFGIGDGRDITLRLLNSGADMIMPIAGPQTLDVVQQVNQRGRPVAIIGVDSPQETNPSLNQPMPGLGSRKILNIDGTDSTNQNMIQFSAEKKLNIAVNQILQSIFNTANPNEGTSFKGFGYHNILALGPRGDSAVGISKAGEQYFYNGLGQENYLTAVQSLATNTTFRELITPITNPTNNYIRLYNTANGKANADGSGEVDVKFIAPYTNGLNNSFESFAPTVNGVVDRLNGSKWKIEE